MRRAGVFAPALFFAFSIAAVAESSETAFIAAVFAGVLCAWLGFRAKSALALALGLASLSLVAGPTALAPIAAVVLAPHLGLICALAASIAVLLAAHVGSIAPSWLSGLSAPAGSVILLFLPSLIWVLIRIRQQKPQYVAISIAFLSLVGVAVAWGLGIGLIEIALFTAPWTRLCAVGMLTVLVTTRPTLTHSDQVCNYKVGLLTALGVVVFAITIGFAMKTEPITDVVFDESHGQWESTTAQFRPKDFGRGALYTYSVLSEYLRRLGFRVRIHTGDIFPEMSSSSLLVIKMPTTRLSKVFIEDLEQWVQKGGRVLFIADHTDLFNTSQHLNAWLTRHGMAIAHNAVFDRLGLPPESVSWEFGAIFHAAGRSVHRYLTGASFSSLPIYSSALMTYGASFAEPAVYFRANRFGYFNPSPYLPFANHAAVAAVPVGRGLIMGWLDSTHWSNFAMFVGTYQAAISKTIDHLEQVYRLRMMGAMVFVGLVGLGLALFVRARWIVLPLISVVAAAWAPMIAGGFTSTRITIPDISVTVGASAGWEILTPLVAQPDANFARALTALQKYGVIVRVGRGAVNMGSGAQNLLWLNPDPEQLPDPMDVISALRAGKRLVFLLPQSRSGAPAIRNWLGQLALGVRTERALTAIGEVGVAVQDRRSLTLRRVAITRLLPLADTLFLESESHPLFQRFQLRQLANESTESTGELLMSFASEQFSDAAIGDVWDGVPADDLAQQRESELAAIFGLTSSEVQAIWSWPAVPIVGSASIAHFVVLRNGKVLVEGELGKSLRGETPLALTEDPQEFLTRLQKNALAFTRSHCSKTTKDGFCEKTFVANNLTEWFVVPSWTNDRLSGIELIHDGRLSDGGGPLNVVFSSK